MKVIRRLCRRGHSFHVSLPQRMLDYLRWKVTDGIVIEVTTEDTVVLRRVRPGDLISSTVQPMNLDLPAVGTK